MVEISGIEPLTPCLQSRCSPSWAIPPYLFRVGPWKLNNEFWKKSFVMLTLEFKSACFIWFGLHRKEVIQPHLPIRLPCYDFTPVANPTFGSVLTRLDYWLRVLPAPMVWRAVCTRPGNVFTAACWSAITSNSIFMQAGCSLQSELRMFLGVCSTSLSCFPLLTSIVVRV